MRHRGLPTWARVASVVLAVGFVTSAMLSVGAGPTAGPAEAQGTAIEASRSVKNDASPRLDSLPVLPPQGTLRPPRRVSPAPDRPAPPALRPDPVRQAAPPMGRMPAPSVSFDGIA